MKKTILCWFWPLCCISGIFFCLGVVNLALVFLFFADTDKNFIVVYTVISIIFLALSVVFCILGSARLLIGSSGIEVVGVFKIRHFINWENLNHAYYVKDFKNNYFWVVSSKALGKKYIHRVIYSPRNIYGNRKEKIYLIPISLVKESDRLRELLEGKIAHVEYICEYPKYY